MTLQSMTGSFGPTIIFPLLEILPLGCIRANRRTGSSGTDEASWAFFFVCAGLLGRRRGRISRVNASNSEKRAMITITRMELIPGGGTERSLAKIVYSSAL
jgi:hypothetical protein